MKVEIYSKSHCPFCEKAKHWFDSHGYEYTEIIIEDKSTLLQITYAEDFLDIKTHEEISQLVPLRKCRIISAKDLKKQQYYFERTANIGKKNDEDSKK